MSRTGPIFTILVCLLVAAPAAAIDWDKIAINGYTSFEFEKQLDKSGGGDKNGSFDSDGFDLVLNFQISDKVRAATDFTWEHGAATEDDRGNVAVEYAFIEYTFSDLAKVRVGKMFTPFGVFNQIHTAKPAFLSVKEAASTNKPDRIVEDAEVFFPRWGAGIALQGDGSIGWRQFDYDILVANGEQDGNAFEEDDNGSKSLTGRFRIDAAENLRVGASFYQDHTENPEVGKIRSSGVELDWNAGGFRLLAEAVIGSQDSKLGSTDQMGWFVQPSYHFENGLTPYLRYDWIDPDTDRGSDEGSDLIIGLNYEISKWFMIKVENNFFQGARSSTLSEFPGRNYNEIKAAVVLGF